MAPNKKGKNTAPSSKPKGGPSRAPTFEAETSQAPPSEESDDRSSTPRPSSSHAVTVRDAASHAATRGSASQTSISRPSSSHGATHGSASQASTVQAPAARPKLIPGPPEVPDFVKPELNLMEQVVNLLDAFHKSADLYLKLYELHKTATKDKDFYTTGELGNYLRDHSSALQNIQKTLTNLYEKLEKRRLYQICGDVLSLGLLTRGFKLATRIATDIDVHSDAVKVRQVKIDQDYDVVPAILPRSSEEIGKDVKKLGGFCDRAGDEPSWVTCVNDCRLEFLRQAAKRADLSETWFTGPVDASA